MPDRTTGLMKKARVTSWSGSAPPSQRELLDLMNKEKLEPYAWSNQPGDEYPPHTHAYGKVIYVSRGSITWILPETDEEVETRQGDRLELPPQVVHAAQVGKSGVTCLEAHV